MKIYTSAIGPNPAALRNVLELKNMDIPVEEIDLIGGENRGEAFLKINPAGQLPCLETDSGAVIAEVAAIAEYLEELQPDPNLCGASAEERAITRMRMRQIDYLVVSPMMAGYRHSEGKDFFAGRMRIDEVYGPPSKLIAADGLAWLDKQIDGQIYLCGDKLTYVDAISFPVIGFLAKVSQPLDPALVNLNAYMARMSEHEVIGKNK